MRSSEALNELATALAKAQGKMTNATLNKVNPHFKSKYADLAAIRDAVTLPLASEGIAVLQVVGSDEGGSYLTTRLVHTSGQWVESIHPLPATAKPQEFGSALTYARRYSLAAICGISAEEDDDANGAGNEPTPTARPSASRTVAPQSKTATSPTEEFVKNQLAIIVTLTLDGLKSWEAKHKGNMERLAKADAAAADEIDAAIAARRNELRNYGIAAE